MFNAFSTKLGLLPILLLIVLLIIKELLRAYGLPRSGGWSRALNIAITGLLPVVGLVFVMRFLNILGIR
jgi:hypothetical protein